MITGITAAVLALDVMTGSNLQLNTLMGYTALVAGRFYGFGNQAFSLFAVASILTGGVAGRVPAAGGPQGARGGDRRGDRGVSPSRWTGSPRGAATSAASSRMVPAFAMLALMVAGQRVSPLLLVPTGLAGAALVLFISFLELQERRTRRTWAGSGSDLVDGRAWGIVARKFDAMVNSLGYWPYTLAVAAAVVFLFFVLARPDAVAGVGRCSARLRAQRRRCGPR